MDGIVILSLFNFFLCRGSKNVLQLSKRSITSKIHGGSYLKAEIVRKKGKSVLADPIYNKGLGFPRNERDRLAIRGLLPSQV